MLLSFDGQLLFSLQNSSFPSEFAQSLRTKEFAQPSSSWLATVRAKVHRTLEKVEGLSRAEPRL
jgi:hypothetical protein